MSNFLQDRHKFVVDILLTVVMLEEELDSLAQRIEEFEQRQREGRPFTTASVDEAELATSGATNAECAAAPQSEEVDFEKELLVEQHRAALKALQDTLLAKKEAQLKLLAETFDRSRGVADYVNSVFVQALQKLCGGGVKVEDIRTSLSQSVTNATLVQIQAAQDEKNEVIAATILAEEQHGVKVAEEALNANLLILQHERELSKLKLSLLESQTAQSRALKERLSKRKADRAAELVGSGKSVEEAEQMAAAECAAEEEAGLTVITAEAQATLNRFTEQSLGDVKSAAEAAAARLEDSLNAQKSEQQRALMKRLEKRKLECQRRVEQQLAAAASAAMGAPAAISEEQKALLLSAELAKVDSAAEAEAALIEAQNIAAVRAVRAHMVTLVRAEHEKECERLETELLAQKDRRVKDLKNRLDKKKADRAKEILASTESATSSAVAVALANEEFSAEEKAELAKIALEADTAVEEARKVVLGSLVELHQKESVRLEEDLKYQEKMQKTNLANRLDRQRKLRERELIAAAAAANVDTVTTATTTGDTTVAAAVTATPATEEDIKARVEAEMRAIAEREEQVLQQSLAELRAQHDKEETQLADELTYKKTSADKRLKDRLAQRNSKAAQMEALKNARAAQVSALANSSATGDSASTVTPADAAAGLTAAAAVAVVAAVVPPVDDGSMAVEQYMSNLKYQQKELLDRLALFVQFEKTATVAEKQAAVKAATNKQQNETALNELAKTAILFDHLNEFLAVGLKKTFLYETKVVKDFALRCKQNSTALGNVGSNTNGYRFTAAEVTELATLLTTSSASKELASEKILERFQRDIAGRLDSQALERRNSVAQMRSNGSSVTQIHASRAEMMEYHTEVVLTEVEKSIITLAGVWINAVLLSENVDGAQDAAVQQNNQDDHHHAGDSDQEDEDAFPESSSSKVDHRSKKMAHFGQRIIQWFEGMLSLLRLYSTTPFAMRIAFDERCAEVSCA